MNRRDYELIAKVLKDNRLSFNEECFERLLKDFCEAIKQENHTFNEAKFREHIFGKEKKNVETNQENV
jgi:hypothetical protein